MKKAKMILALVLVAALVCMLFAACAKSGGGSTPAANTDDKGEKATIKMVIFDFNSTGADHHDRIQKAVNDISVPAINVETDILFLNMGDFASKVQTSIAGGEQIDLMTASIMNNASTLYQASMLKDVTEELKTYAPAALEVVGDAVKTYTWGGKIYGLPTQRNLLTSRFIIMNKDVLDELNLTDKAQNMTTWTEFEEILAAVKEAKSGMACILPSPTPASSIRARSSTAIPPTRSTPPTTSCGLWTCCRTRPSSWPVPPAAGPRSTSSASPKRSRSG